MGRPKTDYETVKMRFDLRTEVADTLRVNASRMGISMTAYVSMLIMDKQKENLALKIIDSLTVEQMREAVGNNA